MVDLAVVAAVVLGYALVSRRLEGTSLTGPVVFTAVGMLVAWSGLGLEDRRLDAGAVGLLAEATLVLVLYTDAIRIDLRTLRRDHQLPLRLLGIGLPLTIILGAVAAWLLLPGVGWAVALALGAVLAATDAALGQAVVGNPSVPVRVRQSINVESGLNDGIALPMVTAAAALVGAESTRGPAEWVGVAVWDVGVGVGIGVVIGACGGWLLDRFVDRGWVEGALRQLATLAIGVGAFAVAEVLGASGFVAAFTAGIGFGFAAREHCEGAYDFAEDEGVLLALLTFLAFGATLAIDALGAFDLRTVAYVVASLTVVRMLPAAVALLGSGTRLPTVAFLGWFGPRGLASILFGVLVLEEAGRFEAVLPVVSLTVLASVVLHGLSAAPLARRYAAWYERAQTDRMVEAGPATEHPVRGGMMGER